MQSKMSLSTVCVAAEHCQQQDQLRSAKSSEITSGFYLHLLLWKRWKYAYSSVMTSSLMSIEFATVTDM